MIPLKVVFFKKWKMKNDDSFIFLMFVETDRQSSNFFFGFLRHKFDKLSKDRLLFNVSETFNAILIKSEKSSDV